METGYNQNRWISHFRCMATLMNFVYTHNSKAESTAVVKQFHALVKTRYNRTIVFIRLDGERSLGHEFDRFIETNGITAERSAAYTPEQNGAAERSGGVIIVKARAIQIGANLPSNLWPEVVKAAGYLSNRTPIAQLG